MNSFEEFEIKNGSKPEKRKYLQKKFLVKTENPKVSIIVPIYNVEDYLEECMESIVRLWKILRSSASTMVQQTVPWRFSADMQTMIRVSLLLTRKMKVMGLE